MQGKSQHLTQSQNRGEKNPQLWWHFVRKLKVWWRVYSERCKLVGIACCWILLCALKNCVCKDNLNVVHDKKNVPPPPHLKEWVFLVMQAVKMTLVFFVNISSPCLFFSIYIWCLYIAFIPGDAVWYTVWLLVSPGFWLWELCTCFMQLAPSPASTATTCHTSASH